MEYIFKFSFGLIVISMLLVCIMISGCSTLDKTAGYIPVESAGWSVTSRPKGFHDENSTAHGRRGYAEFACRGKVISVQEYQGSTSTLLGPIMVPLIPMRSHSY